MTDEELIRLARISSRVRPGPGQISRDDCFQIAYLEGLSAKRSAERRGVHVSTQVLLRRMYRAVRRKLGPRATIPMARAEQRDVHGTIDGRARQAFDLVDAADCLQVLAAKCPTLSDGQRRAIRAVADGATAGTIARDEAVSEKVVRWRLTRAVRRLRALECPARPTAATLARPERHGRAKA